MESVANARRGLIALTYKTQSASKFVETESASQLNVMMEILFREMVAHPAASYRRILIAQGIALENPYVI
jgi:hypothetical protein